jgi:hypothetical protein
MTKRFSAVLSTALLAISASTAAAQATQAGNPVELGMDAVVATSLGDTRITTVSIPNAEFRVGFFLSNNVSIEPRLGITSISGDGTFTSYKGELGVLYHFGGERVGSGVYVRPFAGFTGYSSAGSDTQANAGIGLGVKIPFAERLATRIEANYVHGFSSDMGDGNNQLAASIGLSFFTR